MGEKMESWLSEEYQYEVKKQSASPRFWTRVNDLIYEYNRYTLYNS